MSKLTETLCRTAQPHDDGRTKFYSDGPQRYGLALKAQRCSGGKVARSFVQTITIYGRRTMLGLGPHPLVTLAEARDKAFENARRVRQGKPVHTRKAKAKAKAKAAGAVTFGQAWQRLYERDRPTWKHAKTAKQWRQRFDTYMSGPVGGKPVAAITLDDIEAVVAPIWHSKPDAGKAVLATMLRVLDNAAAHGDITAGNVPTRQIVKQRLGPQHRSERDSYAAVPHGSIPAAIAAIASSDANTTHRAALLFSVLTVARQIEARRADWADIAASSEGDVWTQSGKAMKAGKTHKVPLTAAVAAMLDARGRAGAGRVFPSGSASGMIAENAMGKVVKRLGFVDVNGKPATAHGFRSSFADWATAAGYEKALIGLCMAHAEPDKVHRAYARSDRLAERRELLTAWADYCLSAVADPAALWADLAA